MVLAGDVDVLVALTAVPSRSSANLFGPVNSSTILASFLTR